MALRIATWNINSVRIRCELVERLVAGENPDVLCLQETKVDDPLFPRAVFEKLGYRYIALNGAKGYHGVATLSRLPFDGQETRVYTPEDGPRHVQVSVGGIDIHNYYVPAGGDEPDPDVNPKFRHKLAYLDGMTAHFSEDPAARDRPAVLVGDLNIAPLEDDVWSHKALANVVSHTAVEIERLARVQASASWVDAMRVLRPIPEKLYTWWSYRAKDWSTADKGRRLDHVWLTPPVAGSIRDLTVLREARGWDRPSDHCPVVLTIG